MNGNKRVHSIARKIGNSWTLRTLRLMLSLDILFLVLLFLGLIYYHEISALGSQWQPRLVREFACSPKWSITALLDSAYYFQAPDGAWHSVAMAPILKTLIPFGGILAVIEVTMLVHVNQHAHKKSRSLLKPLDKIVSDMEAFSRVQSESHFYEDRLRDLETAIDDLAPDHPDARLRTDVQELTGLESAINNLLVRMHESYRQQAQFVSDASHELRTPIAVIQGYANMLARWGKDDPQVLEESISAIQSESDYMKKLVEELLFLARGEIGRNPFDPKPISLTNLIREVCEESAMIDPDHTWTFRQSPETEINADAEMLKQCARVLCENARKYTPAGGEISLRVASEDGGACFIVQDEGIGIPAKDIAHVFNRFYRSDPARDRNSGGSGLGLSIAKWIVDRHGGHFEVLSSEGMGTRFTVHLPKA